MHSEFYTYLRLGWQHIADYRAYDHILFVIALCAMYLPSEWRRLLILVTAFTIGHSLTLALSALNILVLPSKVIEFLIPVTILITALLNYQSSKNSSQIPIYKYFLPLIFGFIHGMGFSNYFKSLLGKEESVVKPLFAFNIGIEIGQLLIVFLFMAITYLFVNFFKIKHSKWSKLISGIIVLLALYLMWETKFW
ncbi:MAG: HupE/UreJ family protein [Saprospiraceae bacterium]